MAPNGGSAATPPLGGTRGPAMPRSQSSPDAAARRVRAAAVGSIPENVAVEARAVSMTALLRPVRKVCRECSRKV